jgi:hypothetical protein
MNLFSCFGMLISIVWHFVQSDINSRIGFYQPIVLKMASFWQPFKAWVVESLTTKTSNLNHRSGLNDSWIGNWSSILILFKLCEWSTVVFASICFVAWSVVKHFLHLGTVSHRRTIILQLFFQIYCLAVH